MSYKSRRNLSCQKPYWKRWGFEHNHGKVNHRSQDLDHYEYLPNVAGNASRRSLLIPGREIPDGPYIWKFNKEDLRHSDLELSEIQMPIDAEFDSFIDRVESGRFRLSNVPTLVEYARLQRYHIKFSEEQLMQMLNTPKVIVDRQHCSFEFQKAIINRTSFIAVAPSLVQDQLPCLYRLSIARELKNPEHYSVSAYAIVSGLADGYVFLGRVDNNNSKFHQNMVRAERKFIIEHENGKTIVVPNKNLDSEPVTSSVHNMPFPHIHLADPNYKEGDIPEQCEPVAFVENIPDNVSDSLLHMLQMTQTDCTPRFYNRNVALNEILREMRDISAVQSSNTQALMRETKILERMFVETNSQTYKNQELSAQKNHDQFGI